MRRALSPTFFAIEPIFSPVLVAIVAIVAIVAALLVPGRLTCAVLAASTLVQTFTALSAAWTVRGQPFPWRYAALEVVRVFLIFACWVSACLSRTVSWRGNALAIGRGTVVTPISPVSTEDEDVTARAA